MEHRANACCFQSSQLQLQHQDVNRHYAHREPNWSTNHYCNQFLLCVWSCGIALPVYQLFASPVYVYLRQVSAKTKAVEQEKAS